MEYWHDLGLTRQEVNGIAMIVGVIGLSGLLALPWAQEWLRGYKMKQQRRQEIHNELADSFTEVILDKVLLKSMTMAEAREEGFARLKRAFPDCKNLYPSEELLKEAIEKRLGKVSPELQALSDRTPIEEPARAPLFTRRR